MKPMKYLLKIEGMACGMCEAHICSVIRRTVPSAKKVTASHRRGEAGFLSDGEVNGEALKAAIAATGYTCLSVEAGPPEKKGLFGR